MFVHASSSVILSKPLLFQNRHEIDLAEEFCVNITGGTVSLTNMALIDISDSRDTSMDAPFSMEELEAVLLLCKSSSSPRPEGKTYTALRHLGQAARRELL